jgi:predicted AAA+ superfamily ATPase
MVNNYLCHMINRITQLPLLLREFPAVAILGPRQVGKSTLAKLAAADSKKPVLYLDMELQSDRRKVEDAESFFETNRNKLIVIDEIQQMPELFTALRPEIDALRKPGRFILTGSADPQLIKGVSESLAGRIAYMPLTPFKITELAGTKYNMQRHWFRGGFPNALLAKNDEAFHRWMENYIQSFIQRDLQLLFDVTLSSLIIRNLWTMVAHNNGGILNAETYARSLGVTSPTVKRYLQFLEGAFLIRQLQPWFANSNKRLVKSPKIYIRDSGIVHHLTHIAAADKLAGNIIAGASWEGYVIEEIIKQLPIYLQAYFYRTHNGAEADLVLVKNNKPIASIEVKHSKAPVLSTGYYHAVQELGTQKNYLIYTGFDEYTTKEKVVVCSLSGFINKIKKL